MVLQKSTIYQILFLNSEFCSRYKATLYFRQCTIYVCEIMAQHIDMSNNANDAEVFVYTSVRGERVPCDVVASWSIPPSRQSLITILSTKEVEVGRGGVEGLVIIGKSSFSGCYHHSITKINFPTSLRRKTIGPYQVLFDVPFVFTMTLKALEVTHSTLVFHPSTHMSPTTYYIL